MGSHWGDVRGLGGAVGKFNGGGGFDLEVNSEGMEVGPHVSPEIAQLWLLRGPSAARTARLRFRANSKHRCSLQGCVAQLGFLMRLLLCLIPTNAPFWWDGRLYHIVPVFTDLIFLPNTHQTVESWIVYVLSHSMLLRAEETICALCILGGCSVEMLPSDNDPICTAT